MSNKMAFAANELSAKVGFELKYRKEIHMSSCLIVMKINFANCYFIWSWIDWYCCHLWAVILALFGRI